MEADSDEWDVALPFGWLNAAAKRDIRRALLKAVAIPGCQVPFTTTETPLPPGWGTGGVQVTASLLGREDMLKVIDQGTDDSPNAASIRDFFKTVANVATTTRADSATLIQSRHRIPETKLAEGQILVMQVPQPEVMRRLSPRHEEAVAAHSLGDYGSLHVLFYDSVAQHGRLAISYDHPVLVHGRYVASPSPIPNFDVPKLNHAAGLVLFGAGRERRLYAIPPFTQVEPLEFEDHKFEVQSWSIACQRCGDPASFLDEVIDVDGILRFVCSDTDHCHRRREVSRPAPPGDGGTAARCAPPQTRCA